MDKLDMMMETIRQSSAQKQHNLCVGDNQNLC